MAPEKFQPGRIVATPGALAALEASGEARLEASSSLPPVLRSVRSRSTSNVQPPPKRMLNILDLIVVACMGSKRTHGPEQIFLSEVPMRSFLVGICLSVVLATPSAFSQLLCVTCYGDFKVNNGYFTSQVCNPHVICPGSRVAPLSASFLESPNPGIVARQENGKLLVVAVLKGSPATVAGVRTGDEILAINGKIPGTASCKQSAGWSTDGLTTSLVLRRGSEDIPLKLAVMRLGSLLLASSKLTLASASSRDAFMTSAPFTFGFAWTQESGYVEVDEILSGSPAQAAGLSVGDRIVSINGLSLQGVPDGVSHLADSFVAGQVTVGVADGSRTRVLVLRARGGASILASPTEKVSANPYAASLDSISRP
jgi:membrane-associated protease RseP (regulator of RpoE activity)